MLEPLLAELEQSGRHHDAKAHLRGERMLNITRVTGEYLAILIEATGSRLIAEARVPTGAVS